MKADVDELMQLVDEAIGRVRSHYQIAMRDPTQASAPRALFKSALDQLRSALDYVALEISVKALHRSPATRTYFPYAIKEAFFGERVGQQLPGLAEISPAIYDVIRQAHAFGSAESGWLAALCRLTAENKHVGLTKQVRRDRNILRVAGNAFAFGPGAGATFENCIVDGELLHGRVLADDPIEVTRAALGGRIHADHVRVGVSFIVQGTTWDALSLLDVARRRTHEIASAVEVEIAALTAG